MSGGPPSSGAPEQRPAWLGYSLRVLASVMLLLAVPFFALMACMTQFAFWPGTDMADARVLIVYGPLYTLAALVVIAIACLLFTIRRFPRTAKAEQENDEPDDDDPSRTT